MIERLFRITRPGGIGIGTGPAILLRELVLFRADLRRADWFGRGAPAPRAATIMPMIDSGKPMRFFNIGGIMTIGVKFNIP